MTFTVESVKKDARGGKATRKEGVINFNGKPVNRRATVCLETQHYPDSPNHPDFPTTTLKPGQKYSSKTVYKFTVEK